jgi:hypothetical protein
MKFFRTPNTHIQQSDRSALRFVEGAVLDFARSCKAVLTGVRNTRLNWVGADSSPLFINATKRNYQSINHQKVETKMVKFINKTLGGVLLGTALLAFGCSPDNVKPKDSNSGATVNRFQENAHPVLSPQCSDSVKTQLVDMNGSTFIDYCKPFFGRPCPTTPQKWGTVSMLNGHDSLQIRVTMSFGWYIDKANSSVGSATPLQVDANGRPIIAQDWVLSEIDNDNSWSIYIDKRTLFKDPNGCFSAAMRLKVLKFNCAFCTVVDPASLRDLWITTDGMTVRSFTVNPLTGAVENVADGDPALYQTSNPFIWNWCWQSNCRTQKYNPVYNVNSCDVAPATPLYNCTVVGTGHGCNYGTGGAGTLNNINVTDVRCVDTSANLGTFNFSGPGTLVIPAGQTVTCGINAFYGCTLIVQGTLNWQNTASYNSNMFIYIDQSGVLNRAGSTGSLTLNGTGSVLVNRGTLDVDANLISRGSVYNNGTLTTRNMTLTGGSAMFANKGNAVVEQNLTVNCGSPNTCTGGAESRVQNCGRLDVNTSVNAAAGTNVKNYCALISRGTYTQGGTFMNQGVTVAGLVGAGSGFVNNGNTTLKQASLIATRSFNWGTNRTITLDAASAWIFAGETSINPNPATWNFFNSFGGTGRLIVPTGSVLNGSGTLTMVDMDQYSTGDLPLSNTAMKTTLNPNPYTTLVMRTKKIQDDSVKVCQ